MCTIFMKVLFFEKHTIFIIERYISVYVICDASVYIIKKKSVYNKYLRIYEVKKK